MKRPPYQQSIPELFLAYLKALKPKAVLIQAWAKTRPKLVEYRFKIALYLLLGLLVPAISATMNANHQLQQEQAAKQAVIIKLTAVNKALQALRSQKTDSDAQLAQKQAQEAELKAKVDELNRQLQAKAAARVSVVAPVYGGYGGGSNFGVSLGWGGFPNSYAPGNCTALVASLIRVPNDMGDARNWDNYASSHGYQVSGVPRVGAVAQTDFGYWGHVALVIAVNGNIVEIKEANVYGLGVVDTRWVGVGEYVYIYFS